MDLYEKVRQYVIDNELITGGDTVILGLSGGADSVALFRILNKLKEEIDFKLKAIHVHHGIRQKSADKDEKFVRKLCEEYKTDLEVFHKDIPLICKITKESEEECGRRIRYEIFENASEKYDNAKIAVAHHMNDQAETVIFRMIRGSGVKGLSGMDVKRDNVIRPLLCARKDEIVEFLTGLSQKFRSDETNEDTNYSRNYIRKKILPKFEKLRENSIDHIILLSKEASEVNDFMEKKARELLSNAAKDANKNYLIKDSYIRYRCDVIMAAEPVLARCAIRVMIEDAGVSLKDVSRSHIGQIYDMLNKEGSSEIHLPRGVKVIAENGIVYLNVKRSNKALHEIMAGAEKTDKTLGEGESTEAKNPSSEQAGSADETLGSRLVKDEGEPGYSVEVNENGEYLLPGNIRVKTRLLADFDLESIPMEDHTKWLDYDKISQPLYLRPRKIGDYIIINTRGDEGNLKNYMINEKIPKSERDMIPILASGSKVYWVVGHRISEDVKVTNETQRVLELKIEEGE